MSPGVVGDAMRRGRAAILLEAAFLAAIAAADLLPGHSPKATTVSDLVRGPAPWLVVAAFVLHAASLACLARHLAGQRAASAAWVAAAGMVMVAAFWVDDRRAWVVALHVVGAWLAFGGVAAAAALHAKTAAHARILGVLVVAGTLAMAVSTQAGLFPVLERIQLVLNGAWLIAVAAPSAFSTPAKSPAT